MANKVSPKTYLRVRRFNEALRLMKSRRDPSLVSIANALNFAEHSHFIRDFKAFSRVTPKAFRGAQSNSMKRSASRPKSCPLGQYSYGTNM